MPDKSDNTRKAYERSLDKLKGAGIDIDNIDEHTLLNTVRGWTLNESSQDIIFSAVIDYSKQKGKNELLVPKLSDIMRQHRNKQNTRYMLNTLSDRERTNYISWSNVCRIHEKIGQLLKVNDSDDDLYLDYIILSLYVYHPVRRIEDYSEMYIDDKATIYEEPECILWTTGENGKLNVGYDTKKVKVKENKGERNRYTRTPSKSYFIFERYKTSKSYGRQIIEVDDTLNRLLNKYMEKKGLKDGDKLLSLTHLNLIRKLSNIFKRMINRNISASLLRHIYITHVLNDVKITEQEKWSISQKMAHSMMMQGKYRKVDYDDAKENNVSRTIDAYGNNEINELDDTHKNTIVKRGRPKKYKDESDKPTLNEYKSEWYRNNKQRITEYNKKYYNDRKMNELHKNTKK
jgi:hypothetical protein